MNERDNEQVLTKIIYSSRSTSRAKPMLVILFSVHYLSSDKIKQFSSVMTLSKKKITVCFYNVTVRGWGIFVKEGSQSVNL